MKINWKAVVPSVFAVMAVFAVAAVIAQETPAKPEAAPGDFKHKRFKITKDAKDIKGVVYTPIIIVKATSSVAPSTPPGSYKLASLAANKAKDGAAKGAPGGGAPETRAVKPEANTILTGDELWLHLGLPSGTAIVNVRGYGIDLRYNNGEYDLVRDSTLTTDMLEANAGNAWEFPGSKDYTLTDSAWTSIRVKPKRIDLGGGEDAAFPYTNIAIVAAKRISGTADASPAGATVITVADAEEFPVGVRPAQR